MYPNNFAVKISVYQLMDAPTTVGQHHHAHSVVLRIARAFTPEEAAGCVRYLRIECRIQGLEVAGMLSELLTSPSSRSPQRLNAWKHKGVTCGGITSMSMPDSIAPPASAPGQKQLS